MAGILNFYKEKGISSFQAIKKIKKQGQTIKKIGHAGTLDPNAEGVLPVLIGKATRLNDIFMTFDKAYTFELIFGRETDTYDIWGQTTFEKNFSKISYSSLKGVLETFKGETSQFPPMYSAIKKDGVPLYKLARKGISLDLPAREINIYEIDLLDYGDDRAKIHVKCSKGTYIRSLCRDIGRALDTYATMSSLIRTDYGPFNYKDGIRLEDIGQDYKDILMKVDTVLYQYPRMDLDDRDIERFKQGKKVLIDSDIKADKIRVYHQGQIYGLCKREEIAGQDYLKSWKYFAD